MFGSVRHDDRRPGAGGRGERARRLNAPICTRCPEPAPVRVRTPRRARRTGVRHAGWGYAARVAGLLRTTMVVLLAFGLTGAAAPGAAHADPGSPAGPHSSLQTQL